MFCAHCGNNMSQMQTHNAVVRVTSCSAKSYKTGDRTIFWRTDHCPQFISIRTRDHCEHCSCPQMLRECHRTRQSQYRADTAADNIFPVPAPAKGKGEPGRAGLFMVSRRRHLASSQTSGFTFCADHIHPHFSWNFFETLLTFHES